jgi:hypothetical protein
MRAPLWFLVVSGCAAFAPFVPGTTAAAPAPVVPAAPRPMVMRFIEDDYAAALRQARAEKKPIFIEAWAPW